MFYENLQKLCQQKGTTITGMLKQLHISTSKGTAWKNGTVPKGDILKILSEYFDVSTDYLLGNDSKTVNTPVSDEDIKFALFNGLDGITDAMYEEVKNFADYVKNRELKKGTDDKK